MSDTPIYEGIAPKPVAVEGEGQTRKTVEDQLVAASDAFPDYQG